MCWNLAINIPHTATVLILLVPVCSFSFCECSSGWLRFPASWACHLSLRSDCSPPQILLMDTYWFYHSLSAVSSIHTWSGKSQMCRFANYWWPWLAWSQCSKDRVWQVTVTVTVRHNVHSPQHTYMSSSYRSNRLGLSHWDPYTGSLHHVHDVTRDKLQKTGDHRIGNWHLEITNVLVCFIFEKLCLLPYRAMQFTTFLSNI